MAKDELDAFFDAMKRDSKLAEAFAQATGAVLRDNGFDVDDLDIFNRFNGQGDAMTPPRRGGVTTAALGEEGGRRASTEAVGEEGGRMSTMAIGEEGGPRFR